MKAYKIIFTIVAMVMFAQMMAINAYAYIDVSATSYIIQIVAGIVVAVGAVIGVVITEKIIAAVTKHQNILLPNLVIFISILSEPICRYIFILYQIYLRNGRAF